MRSDGVGGEKSRGQEAGGLDKQPVIHVQNSHLTSLKKQLPRKEEKKISKFKTKKNLVRTKLKMSWIKIDKGRLGIVAISYRHKTLPIILKSNGQIIGLESRAVY